MKNALVNYIKNPKNDELYTPFYAIETIAEYIPNDWVIWEPTDFGDSKITQFFKERGNKVITSHLNEGKSFFEYEPDEHYDVIITNPPYSLKDDFLKRAYELEKPFAFLLPITSLEGVTRGDMFREYGIEVLVHDRRVNFMSEKKQVWFNTSWFCHDILPEKLVFAKLSVKDE